MFAARFGRLFTRAASTDATPAAASAAAAAAGAATKVRLNVLGPHEAYLQNVTADLVTIPGADGVFGVGPNHVPMISELKPGVLSVLKDGGEVKNLFVAGGFAFIRADSTCDITATEAVPLDMLDMDAVRKNLAAARDELAAATDDADKARAQVAIEVYEAMTAAVQ